MNNTLTTYDDVERDLMARVRAMSKEQLAAWYVSNVGYDPWEDDPSITLDEVQSIVGGYAQEAFTCSRCESDCLCPIPLN